MTDHPSALVSVPREPTREMIMAGVKQQSVSALPGDIWSAMLTAAPVREEAPAEAGEEWSRDDIETLISDALIDSFDVDWDTGDGAMAVRRALEKEGLLLRAQPQAREEAQPVPEGVIVAYARNHYRFHPYKPRSEQFRKGIKGRWQKMNEYGHWENSSPPSTITPPAPEAEKLRTALKWIAGCRATTAEGMMMKDHASEALAALQAEQGAK